MQFYGRNGFDWMLKKWQHSTLCRCAAAAIAVGSFISIYRIEWNKTQTIRLAYEIYPLLIRLSFGVVVWGRTLFKDIATTTHAHREPKWSKINKPTLKRFCIYLFGIFIVANTEYFPARPSAVWVFYPNSSDIFFFRRIEIVSLYLYLDATWNETFFSWKAV